MAAGEIGGYLELEDCGGRPYHEGAVALDSARSCLEYLIELRGIRAIALPDLMCDAVPAACARAGAEIRTYEVGEGLLPKYDFDLRPGEWLYLADYYGRLERADVEAAASFARGRVVVDEVQGFFRGPWPGADTIYTCRKFFGVPDGAYLATRDGSRLGRGLPTCRSAGRMAHVLGRCEDGGSRHYGEYQTVEGTIGANGPEAMSEVTRRLLSGIDYEATRRRREENYATLGRLLGEASLLEPASPAGPYMYPLLVADAGDARRELARRGVFVPTLWPNVVEECPSDSFAWRYARNILPLPVDQRYGAADMERVAGEVASVLSLGERNQA